MIILPERGIARGKILLPMRPCEWCAPSQRTSLYAIENETRWRIDARLHDGHRVWRGTFESREDCDAFLWALAKGTLPYEPDIWSLPTPQWHPDLGEDLGYYIFTTIALTTTSASNQTWNVPNDFNSANNNFQSVGGGASGSAAGATNNCSGGGAGAYALTNTLTLTPGGTATFQIKAAAAGVSNSSTGLTGNAGGDVWLSNTGSAPTTTSQGVLAKGGTGGQLAAGTPTGGSGGAAGSCVGNTTFSGGSAGSAVNTGGAGAAGPNGAGGNSAASTASNGGSADNGTTSGTSGTTGNGPTGNAGAGTEFDGSHGCGAGSGGCAASSGNATSGSGGTYGGASGAGGAGGNATGTSGNAGQGLLFITYTPSGSTIFDLSNPLR